MFDPYHKWLAIPPEQRPPTHYQLLGVSPAEKDAEVIEEAALQRSVHLRTYQIGPHAQECTRLLNEVARAKVVLLNPTKRAEYDAELVQGQMSVRSAGATTGRKRSTLIIAAGGFIVCGVFIAVVAIAMNGGDRPLNTDDPAQAPADGSLETKAKPPEPHDIVWIDDALPEGAQLTKTTKIWHWGDAQMQPVLSGTHSLTASGLGHHARFFHGATTFLPIHAGDTLFAYVWLDPKNPPKSIMLQFHDGTRWDHRAYWGDDLCIAKGEPDAPHHRHRGPLPPLRVWTRLEVAAEAVGFVPDTRINGWGLSQFDGTVYYDKMGLRTTALDADVVKGKPTVGKKGAKKK